LRGDRPKEELLARFEGRLAALAGAHTLLVESDWKGADLADLAHQQLDAYGGKNPDRLSISGEAILLPADVATPFGLVLHELATNAVKYGALSNPTGRVAVTWTLSPGNKRRLIRVEWQETGGPTVQKPGAGGFGTTLIESAIPGAMVKRELRAGGLACAIELELPEAAEHGPEGKG
jgi:two-component system CheB/CheR fusion protein